MADNRRISVDDAVECVRFMIYGEDLIGPPTKRETWLKKKYVEGSGFGITWNVAGRVWAEYPSDPALVAEVERARDRADWRKEQYKQAEEWLEDHRFDLSDESFPIDELAREVKREFPDAYSRLARAGGLLTSDRPLVSNPTPDASPATQIPAVIEATKPLDKGYVAIVDFVKAWPLREGVENPYLGAWKGALNAAAKALGVSYDRAKQKYGKTATDEIDAARRKAQVHATPNLG